jgi:uncharacterized protein
MKQQANIMTLNDQSWVLVTGASSGFGEEFARQYAAQGRPLVLVARRLEKLETLATELRERYRVEVIVEQVDLSNVAAVIQLHRRLRERGIAIDILINTPATDYRARSWIARWTRHWRCCNWMS